MPQLNNERHAVADNVRRSLAIENTLTSAQARLFVRCLQTAWHVPPIRWADEESHTQFDDARRLLHTAEVFRQLEGEESVHAMECYRRAGEILEWLVRAGDQVQTIAPLALYAAAAYQLGGLPAMARSLLEQPGATDGNGQLYADFLRADFDAVLRICVEFWRKHPELSSRQGSAPVLGTEDADRISWYIVVELVRCLGLLADSLRRGDANRLSRAQQKLDALERLALRSVSEDAWLLLVLLHATAVRFARASIYPGILRLAEKAPDFEPRLRAFAREQFARGRGILWTSQVHGLERLLSDSSFALCTPTGSGKTLIATLALIKELLLASEASIAPLGLYLVPSRALAGEVEAKLTDELGRAGDFIITGLYGGTDWGITDYWLRAEKPTVLVATVEKAEALMRYIGPMLLARLRVLIIDEAHQVVTESDDRARTSLADHSSRPMRLESLVSRVLALKPSVVRIALTAVAGGAAGPVAHWMEGRDDAEAVGTRYQSTRQLMGALQANPGAPGRIVLDLMNGRALWVRGRDEPVYLPLRIPEMPNLPAATRNSLYHYNEVHVLWTALHLRDGGRRILISVAQEPERTMKRYVEALESPAWQAAVIHSEVMNLEARNLLDETRAVCSDYCGANSYECRLLDYGIATNHGQMPQRLRRLMINLVEQRICSIAIATATLTEGVNLPFDLIFVTSLARSTYDPALQRRTTEPISAAEFRNLAGRAGRPGAAESMEGITLVALPQRPSTRAASMRDMQWDQVQKLDRNYRDLLDRLVADENRSTSVVSPLTLLLQSIRQHAATLLGVTDEEAFLAWLEAAAPAAVSAEVGIAANTPNARLADSLDELDGMLISAIEEIERLSVETSSGAAVEIFLSNLWSRTFSRVAAAREAWLEQAIIRRGRGVSERLYPDAAERKRLYQYGFTPHVGRRFEPVAAVLRAEIAVAADYGIRAAEERIALFRRLGGMLVGDRGYGFRTRDTAADRNLLERWGDVLGWWMQAPGAPQPLPDELRSWQRFVTENLEFRLGVALGAVVAQAWSERVTDPLDMPSLATWRATARLPWFGFWARELLRWGTLDPLVAFALSQGLIRTREQGAAVRREFEAWLRGVLSDPTPEDLIDPQRFIEWQTNLPRPTTAVDEIAEINAQPIGVADHARTYSVLPIISDKDISWIDPAGYVLARSAVSRPLLTAAPLRSDFRLITGGTTRVRRTYTARRARA